MPYTTEALVWLTYAHFLIFLVPATGLGISLLRKERRLRKDATIHRLVQSLEERKKTAA